MSIEWKKTPQFEFMDDQWTNTTKAKDFVSSKCHKVMKDTWITSL
jgi:hypothetical protein